jgi:hypothetical protein
MDSSSAPTALWLAADLTKSAGQVICELLALSEKHDANRLQNDHGIKLERVTGADTIRGVRPRYALIRSHLKCGARAGCSIDCP